MIPTIGIMTGFYILTRCVEMVSVRDDGKPSTLLSVCAALTAAVTVIARFNLVVTGVDIQSLMPEIEGLPR